MDAGPQSASPTRRLILLAAAGFEEFDKLWRGMLTKFSLTLKVG